MNATVAAAPIALTLRGVRGIAVEVPMRIALGTSAAALRAAPLLLVEVETEQGVTGRSYVFCYRPSGARGAVLVLQEAAAMIGGAPVAPQRIAARLERSFALIGVTGIVRLALSALDMALWDALAVAAGLPLASLLGGAPRPLRAYNSCGLGLMGAAAVAEESERLLDGGFRAIKLRLGYPTLAEDIAVTRAVRARAGDDVLVMVDYNQALNVVDALARGRALQSEGVTWLEEPIRHDDHRGNAEIARALELPLQIGENFNGPMAMQQALAADACDLVMPDLGRIGGFSGWMQSAGIAAARGIPISSHLMPEASAHALAASPTCDWLEYVDWADPLLDQPLRLEDGCVVPPDSPGTGLAWDAGAVERYRLA